MSKIVPEITNGSRRLILSETLLLHPEEGLTIAIPLMPGNNVISSKLNFQISFPNDTGDTRSKFEVTDSGALQLTMFNVFKGALSIGTSEPFGFGIGGVNFVLYINCLRIADQVGQLTLTVYQK